jgi:hypothetical protein
MPTSLALLVTTARTCLLYLWLIHAATTAIAQSEPSATCAYTLQMLTDGLEPVPGACAGPLHRVQARRAAITLYGCGTSAVTFTTDANPTAAPACGQCVPGHSYVEDGACVLGQFCDDDARCHNTTASPYWHEPCPFELGVHTSFGWCGPGLRCYAGRCVECLPGSAMATPPAGLRCTANGTYALSVDAPQVAIVDSTPPAAQLAVPDTWTASAIVASPAAVFAAVAVALLLLLCAIGGLVRRCRRRREGAASDDQQPVTPSPTHARAPFGQSSVVSHATPVRRGRAVTPSTGSDVSSPPVRSPRAHTEPPPRRPPGIPRLDLSRATADATPLRPAMVFDDASSGGRLAAEPLHQQPPAAPLLVHDVVRRAQGHASVSFRSPRANRNLSSQRPQCKKIANTHYCFKWRGRMCEHDSSWRHDVDARMAGHGPPSAAKALEAVKKAAATASSPPRVRWGTDGRIRYTPKKQLRVRAVASIDGTPELMASLPFAAPAAFFAGTPRTPAGAAGPSPNTHTPTPTPLSKLGDDAVKAIRAASQSPPRVTPRSRYSTAAPDATNAKLLAVVSPIEKLPFGSLDSVIETVQQYDGGASPTGSPRSSPGRQVLVRTDRGAADGERRPRGDVKALGPQHKDFTRQAVRAQETAWSRMEARLQDERKASRFRSGVLTPPRPTDASLHDSHAHGIRREWDLKAALQGPDSPPRLDRDKLDAMLQVHGTYRQYLLRDMLAANGTNPSSLMDVDETVVDRLQRRLGTVVASSDAALVSATERGADGLLHPTKLYEARVRLQDEQARAAVAADKVKAAQEAEDHVQEALAQEYARYVSVSVTAAPDPDEVLRMRRVHDLIMLARSRTEHLAGEVVNTSSGRVDGGNGTAIPLQSGTATPDSVNSRMAFWEHESEMERLVEAYFAARKHHSAAVAQYAHSHDRAVRPDFSRKAFETAKARVRGGAHPRNFATSVDARLRSLNVSTPSSVVFSSPRQ